MRSKFFSIAPLLIFLLPLVSRLAVADVPECEATLPAESFCKTTVEELHPTQFAVGMRSVREKQQKLENFSKDDRKDYLKEHPVPIVIAPDGGFYPIDHHHLARALWEAGHHKLYARVTRNWRKLSPLEFWKRMEQSHYVYLYDELGNGPLSPKSLPPSIEELRDDPYRSLAADVRDAGGFRKSAVPFAEFEWAMFFRSRIEIGRGERQYQKALEEAVALARSPSARHLPGYLGRVSSFSN